MNKLTVTNKGKLVAQNTFTIELFNRWVAFVDVKPKTVEKPHHNIADTVKGAKIDSSFKSDYLHLIK